MSKKEQLPDYITEEWERMVANARQDLAADCPLIEDEVIIFIDKELKRLQVQEALIETGLMGEGGNFTDKSTKYIPTTLLDFETLAQSGVLTNVKHIS